MSINLKREIIELLERDREFRYAVAGYLGFSEILKKLDTLAEGQTKLWENQQKFWETQNKLLENQRKLWEEIRALRENQNKLWENQNKLWEEIKALREEQNKLWIETSSLKVFMGSLLRTWRTDFERTLLKIYMYELEEKLKERGINPNRIEKFVYIDIEGKYYRKRAKLELYVYMHGEKVYFIEIEAYADIDKVEWFMSKSEIIKKIIGKEPEKLIFITVILDDDAAERAKELGIETIYGAIISKTAMDNIS